MAKLKLSPNKPAYGDDLIVGYAPAKPVLEGHSMHLVVRANETSVTDIRPGSSIPLFDETKSVAEGAAAQGTGFRLSGGSEWSAGGGDATLDLINASGAVVETEKFTVLP